MKAQDRTSLLRNLTLGEDNVLADINFLTNEKTRTGYEVQGLQKQSVGAMNQDSHT